MLEPIAQDPSYHRFADQAAWLGIPNFWNVVTNVPFLLVGLYGLGILSRAEGGIVQTAMKPAYRVLFAGTALVCFGSSWYHLAPSNATLVWDRLPMTIAFMAFFSIVVAEFVSLEWGRRLLLPLLALGLVSIGYWHYSELNAAGDLRLYVLVQFLPMLLIPYILLAYNSEYTQAGVIWLVLAAYMAAKVAEYWDVGIYAMLGLVSGHSIKHVLAAAGIFLFARSLARREHVL
jgi:hypothetical protein